jgi:hypothetical protein
MCYQNVNDNCLLLEHNLMASKYQNNSVLKITMRKIAQNVTNDILVSNYMVYIIFRNTLNRPYFNPRIFSDGAGIV